MTATSAYKTYQKQWRKLERREGIAVVELESEADISEGFQQMSNMRSSRFTKLRRPDFLREEAALAFYRAMALKPAAERIVRLIALRVGESNVAYLYRIDRGGRFSTIISAIDDSIGNAYAPALILFTKLFEQAIAQSYRSGDMGVGWMHYKTRFTEGSNRLLAFERGLTTRGRIAVMANAAGRHVKDWARQQPLMRRIKDRLSRTPIAKRSAFETSSAD